LLQQNLFYENLNNFISETDYRFCHSFISRRKIFHHIFHFRKTAKILEDIRILSSRFITKTPFLIRKSTLIFLLLFTECKTFSQQQNNYVFQHLTTRDGLSSNFIQSIFQDSKGFYWIGTTSGVQIFDGYAFSKPLIAGKDLASAKITETRDGMIWITNRNSLYRYDRIKERFMPVVPENSAVKMDLTIMEDSIGNIWLINQFKLYKYDAGSGTLVTWLELPPTDPAMTSGIIAFNKHTGIIWIQNGTTLYEISAINKKIIKEETMPYQAANMWADDNYLWISFWTQYICRYNMTTGKKDWFLLTLKKWGSQTINAALACCFGRDKTGRLWIGSVDGGLWYLDEATNKSYLLKTDNIRPESFHFNEAVYSIMIDREGSIWVGSDRGLNIFNTFHQRFYTLSNSDLPAGVPSYISRQPFETSTGDLLISTVNGGWLQYDSNFNLKKNFTVTLKPSSTYIDTCKTIVICFAEDKKGRIWIAHRGGVLGIYDLHTGSIQYDQVPEFRKNKISSIQCDSAGNMWFAIRANNNNLIKWDVRLKKYKVYNDSLLNNRPEQESSIIITRQGAIWVQTLGNGIYRFDPVREKIVEIYRDGQPPYKIPSYIQSISTLNDSVIAIASLAEGFYLLNTTKKKSMHLGIEDGLPSNYAKAIATDSYNNYWMAMLSDLVRMNPRSKKIVSFDEDEGILNKSFVYGFTRMHDGRLMITTNSGLLYFNPDSIKIQQPPPDVLITGLHISSKPVLLDSILKADNNNVSLSYDQNFLTFDYVSISYLNRKTTQYYYKLEGLEKEWVKAGTQRVANYTNLSPGNYIFMVRCENRDGVSSKSITYLNIIITPPLWRTWWAWILYGIMICIITYFSYRNHINSLRKKQQAEIKAMVATQEEERKRISRDLHDDVGTKLSALKLLISSLREKASLTTNNEIKYLARSAEQFIKETMQDVRQLLLNLSPTVLEEFGYTTAVEGSCEQDQ
jgi:ligand-binding sensor domain-containing protein